MVTDWVGVVTPVHYITVHVGRLQSRVARIWHFICVCMLGVTYIQSFQNLRWNFFQWHDEWFTEHICYLWHKRNDHHFQCLQEEVAKICLITLPCPYVCLYTYDNSRNDEQIVVKFQMRNFTKLIDSFQVLVIQSTDTFTCILKVTHISNIEQLSASTWSKRTVIEGNQRNPIQFGSYVILDMLNVLQFYSFVGRE
jgi:hypothetical protein